MPDSIVTDPNALYHSLFLGFYNSFPTFQSSFRATKGAVDEIEVDILQATGFQGSFDGLSSSRDALVCTEFGGVEYLRARCRGLIAKVYDCLTAFLLIFIPFCCVDMTVSFLSRGDIREGPVATSQCLLATLLTPRRMPLVQTSHRFLNILGIFLRIPRYRRTKSKLWDAVSIPHLNHGMYGRYLNTKGRETTCLNPCLKSQSLSRHYRGFLESVKRWQSVRWDCF
jgi:hypothetical protein